MFYDSVAVGISVSEDATTFSEAFVPKLTMKFYHEKALFLCVLRVFDFLKKHYIESLFQNIANFVSSGPWWHVVVTWYHLGSLLAHILTQLTSGLAFAHNNGS